MAQEQIERIDGYSVHTWYHHLGPDAKKYDSGDCADGGETVETARENLIFYVKFHQEQDCQITKAYIERYCVHCHGEGKLYYKPRSGGFVRKTKRCPACKGKDSSVTIETWIDLPKELYQY